MKKFICKNEEETKIIAQDFAKSLNGGEIIFMFGDLGAGKTTFVKSVAKELGITQTITSPTFTLMNMYKAKNDKTLCHFDLYRLENIEELEMLGFEEYFYSNNAICFIEWPQILSNSLQKPHKTIIINKINEFEREIILGENNENIIN